jgi:transmembrane sensor
MRMTEPEFKALLDKYLNGNASPEERELLDQFFDSYRDQHTDIKEIDLSIKEEILKGIQRKQDFQDDAISTFQGTYWLKIAAAILFVLLAGYGVFNRFSSSPNNQSAIAFDTIEYKTSRGQKAEVELPDGTHVRLNSNSHLSYPSKFEGDTREVELHGEAYFNVTHDASKPFIVHSGDASTKVLGTSFNVNANSGAVTITLVEGKVNVSTVDSEAMLTPNQQATITSGSKDISTRNVDVSGYTAWTNNRLIFDNTKLEEAFEILENWYNVDINVSNEALKSCVITATYENESLENVLSSFQFMLKVDYTINKRVVTISGNGCN